MESLSDLMAQDAQASTDRLPTDEQLLTVAQLVERQLQLERELSDQEAKLARIKDELEQVRGRDLPNAVESFGFIELKLTDGRRVIIKEEVHAGITKENQAAAFAWLEETNNDGIIKNEVKCAFGKGQNDEVRELVELLTSKGFSYANNRSVHPSTLKAFVRQQLESGSPIPTDLFSIFVQKVAQIK